MHRLQNAIELNERKKTDEGLWPELSPHQHKNIVKATVGLLTEK